VRTSLSPAPPTSSAAGLHERLLARRDEITQTILTRVQAVSPEQQVDPDYAEGLRIAVRAAVDYAIAAVESGVESPGAVPGLLLEQARAAARCGIRLDVVLRRYLIGYSLLGVFFIEEAADSGLVGDSALGRLLWAQAGVFDRLLASIADEYGRELRPRPQSLTQRRTERVEKILAGEPLEFLDVDYELDGWHVGLIGEGPAAVDAVRRLGRTVGRRSILLERPEGTFWAWLGGSERMDPETLERHFAEALPPQTAVAMGEPCADRAGWRMTHQQARAAMPIARRGPSALVRYRDVALLSSVSRDDLLAASLRDIYLAPLEDGGEGKGALLETLRAYFASERNVSSAAAALGLNRRTVANRLRTTEERLGCSLLTNAAEIEAALRLHEFDTDSKDRYAS
jgi:hypothetical protein